MRHAPGKDAAFDAQMRAIAALPAEERLAWLSQRRRSLWEAASTRTRELWVKQWLKNPHHLTLEEYQRAHRG